MKNEAFFMTGLEQMEKRDVPMPAPKEKQVVVKLEYVGICGSDVHYYENGRIGDFIVDGDFILGHECAGTVVELGEGVKDLKVGDRVSPAVSVSSARADATIFARMLSSLQLLRIMAVWKTISHFRKTCALNCRTTSPQKKAHWLSRFLLVCMLQNRVKLPWAAR